jgi:type IV pilus assembly protein PilA
MKSCPNCGQPGLDWHRFCMRCGMDISAVPASAAPPQYAAPAPNAQQASPQQYYAAAPSKTSNKTIWLIVGAVAILPTIAIVLIIAAVAIPNLMRARIAANEASAVGSLRTINTAAITYRTQFNHYPEGLASMGPAVAGVGPEFGAGLIDETLASGRKNGYVFTYHVIDSKNSGTLDDYEITARPFSPHTDGWKSFYSDSSGVVRVSRSGPADKDSPPI